MNKSSFFIIGQHAVIEALKNPKSFGIKLFCESKFWEISIKAVKPKIIVQTKFVEETLKNVANRMENADNV